MASITPAWVLFFALLPSFPGTTPRSVPAQPVTAGAAVKAPFELRVTPWRAGETLRSTNTSHSILKTQIYSSGKRVQEFDQVEDRSSIKSIDILDAAAFGPTKLRVTYHALHFLQAKAHAADPTAPRHPDEAEPENPLAGRTFVLVRGDTEFRVLDGDEKAIEGPLAALVLEEESIRETNLRRAGDMLAISLAGRALPVDAPIDVVSEIARVFVDGHDELKHVAMKVTPRVRRDIDGRACHVFDARLEATEEGGGDKPATAIDLSGEVWFDATTGRYAGIELAGRLHLGAATADAKRVVEISADGPWKISERVSYSAKP